MEITDLADDVLGVISEQVKKYRRIHFTQLQVSINYAFNLLHNTPKLFCDAVENVLLESEFVPIDIKLLKYVNKYHAPVFIEWNRDDGAVWCIDVGSDSDSDPDDWI